jgi:hypothetical protein
MSDRFMAFCGRCACVVVSSTDAGVMRALWFEHQTEHDNQERGLPDLKVQL